MCGRFYLDTMHVDYANLIMRYLSIQWSDLKTENNVATVRISRLFLWYAMNELMHVMWRQTNACNARTNWYMQCNYDFWDTWIGHSSHSPWFNHGCKIEFYNIINITIFLMELLLSVLFARKKLWNLSMQIHVKNNW